METTLKAADVVKVGDILVNVWGYSMTLVDFYRVSKVNAKSVVIVPISSVETSTGYLSGTAVPRTDGMVASVDLLRDDQPVSFRAFLRDGYNGKPVFVSSLGGSVKHWINVWDGTPKYFNHCD